MDHIFQYVYENDYFICTIGDQRTPSGAWTHPVRWGTTSFVKNQLHLDDLKYAWILDEEFVMGGFIGLTRNGASYFLDELYAWTKDVRFYADDGTAPNGWGCARHDQVLLSYLAYSKDLKIFLQDGMEGKPAFLPLNSGEMLPFYITSFKKFLHGGSHVFNVRTNNEKHAYYQSKIRYKTAT